MPCIIGSLFFCVVFPFGMAEMCISVSIGCDVVWSEFCIYLLPIDVCVCECVRARFIWEDFNYFSLFIFHAASMHCTFFVRHFLFCLAFAFIFCDSFSCSLWLTPLLFALVPYCKWIAICMASEYTNIANGIWYLYCWNHSEVKTNEAQLNLVQVIIRSLRSIRAHPMWWCKNKNAKEISLSLIHIYIYIHIKTVQHICTFTLIPSPNPNPNQIRTDLLRKSNQITHKGISTSLFLQSTNPLHVIGTCIAFWCVNILYRRRIVAAVEIRLLDFKLTDFNPKVNNHFGV